MARIDDSHAPFKRTTRIGPGPKKRGQIVRTNDWECRKAPKVKGAYVQICTYVGENKARRGKKIKVKTSVAKKKKYNKLYRAWLKKTGKARTGKALPSYKCKKTPVAKKCK
jgi:hypothetical protein